MIRGLLLFVLLICSGCATTDGAAEGSGEGSEPVVIDAMPDATGEAAAPADEAASKQDEGEVPLAVAESEQPPADDAPPEVVVQGHIRNRHEAIHDLVTEGQALLRDVELKYVLTGKGKRQTLRGRPVAFALWSELKEEWTVAQLELPRPPLRWKPGRKPFKFLSLTPGIDARHVKGTGAEPVPSPNTCRIW